jgi:hypothetical protein
MEATAMLENGTETQTEMTIASKRSKEREKALMRNSNTLDPIYLTASKTTMTS